MSKVAEEMEILYEVIDRVESTSGLVTEVMYSTITIIRNDPMIPLENALMQALKEWDL